MKRKTKKNFFFNFALGIAKMFFFSFSHLPVLIAHICRPGCRSPRRARELPHHALGRVHLQHCAEGRCYVGLQLSQARVVIRHVHRQQPARRGHPSVRWDLFYCCLCRKLGREFLHDCMVAGRECNKYGNRQRKGVEMKGKRKRNHWGKQQREKEVLRTI